MSWNLNPELNAATRWGRSDIGTSDCQAQPVPPGTTVPATRVARSALVFIHAAPTTMFGSPALGRKTVVSSEGRPAGAGPTGCHAPSPGRGSAMADRTSAGNCADPDGA